MNRDSTQSVGPVPQIEPQWCTGCGLCVLVCPARVLTIHTGLARVTNADACRYHGFCELICPTGAIQRLFEVVVRETKEKLMSQSSSIRERYYPDTRNLTTFGKDGPRPQFLLNDDRLKVILAGLEPGQQIPVHPETLAMYHFLEGTGVMTVGEEEFAVAPGATIIAPAGAKRGMKAENRLVFLAAKLG